MIEKLCPLIASVLELGGVPATIACAVAGMVPKLVYLAKEISDKGGDVQVELDMVLDGVEAVALIRAEKGFQ